LRDDRDDDRRRKGTTDQEIDSRKGDRRRHLRPQVVTRGAAVNGVRDGDHESRGERRVLRVLREREREE
jgi:hypothetical protein